VLVGCALRRDELATLELDTLEMCEGRWVGTGMAAARLATPNGFPDPDTNSMITTAAFLNFPRFDKDAPLEINYGGFGEVFAHEFVHIAEVHNYGAIGQPQELWSAVDIAAATHWTRRAYGEERSTSLNRC